MPKQNANARNDKGGPRTRLGTKVVASIAALSLVASMCPGTAALAFANDQLAAGAADTGAQALAALAADDVPADAWEVDPYPQKMGTGAYKVTGNVEINPGASGSSILVEKGAKVLIYIAENATLTVKGEDAKGNGVGHAAILVPEGSSLTIAGAGTLNATGGNAGTGADGGAAEGSFVLRTGQGGNGGAGGGGGGAGIGTNGGKNIPFVAGSYTVFLNDITGQYFFIANPTEE